MNALMWDVPHVAGIRSPKKILLNCFAGIYTQSMTENLDSTGNVNKSKLSNVSKTNVSRKDHFIYVLRPLCNEDVVDALLHAVPLTCKQVHLYFCQCCVVAVRRCKDGKGLSLICM